MPDLSDKCTRTPVSTSFQYQSSQETSKWYEPFVGFEEGLFLAKMDHTDTSVNRSWTIRIGQGGNIYSLVGEMGETVPPQEHPEAPWVDEVWQAVTPLGLHGDPDNDPTTGKFFIHEAGTYQRDGNYTETPFYSPTLGSYCGDSDGECGFVSWVRECVSVCCVGLCVRLRL